MVNDIAVQDFVNAIKETPTDTNTTYQATVSRIDDEGVVWVCIHGSEKETPTASTSAEVKRGDSVTVQWRSNKLYIGGNYSNPSAGIGTVMPSVDFVTELIDKDITVNSINAATGYIGELTSKKITAEDITADHATIKELDVESMAAATAYIRELTADNITAEDIATDHATVGNLDANYAKINAANVTDLSAQNAWVNKIMIQTGLLAHEGTVFTLDAIQVNAANITAGTIDVNRLIVTVDGEKYLVEIDPTTHQPSYEKLDGGIVEPRTITADKIVAHDITVQEITTENLVGTNGWINLNQGKFFYTTNGSTWANTTNGIMWDGTSLKIKGDVNITAGNVYTKTQTDTALGGKVGNNEVITKINASSEGVQIQAAKVDIAGAAVFNNYSTTQQMNNAISGAVDDVQTEIDAKKSIHTLNTSYSYQYSTLIGYAAEGVDAGNWDVSSPSTTAGVKVGDTVRLKCSVSDMSDAPVYVVGTVTSIDSPTRLHMISHGLDTTVIDGGNILTNSITANQLDTNQINNSGVLNTGALTVGAQNSVLNSKIQIGGRNLFINGKMSRDVYVTNYGGIAGSNNCVTSAFIPVNGGDSVILQNWEDDGSRNDWWAMAFYTAATPDSGTSNSSFIDGSCHSAYFANGYKMVSYEAPSNAKFVRVSRQFTDLGIGSTWNNGDNGNSVKVEIGTNPTDFTLAPEDTKKIHNLSSTYSISYATARAWAAEGHDAGSWTVNSTSGVDIGDTVRIKCTLSDMNDAVVYIQGTVTNVTSTTTLRMLSHGLDTTVIDGGMILTGTVAADRIDAANLTIGGGQLSGTVPMARLTSEAQKAIQDQGIKILNTSYSNTYSNLIAWSIKAFDTYAINTSETPITNISAGNTVALRCWDSTHQKYVYILAYVYEVASSTQIKVNPKGFYDPDISSYITKVGSDGIKVFDGINTTNYAQIDSNGTHIYKGGSERAVFGETVRLKSASGFPQICVDANEAWFAYSANDYATLNSNGFNIVKNGTSVAFYGDSARIGKAASKHISLDATNGMQIFTGTESASTNVAQFSSSARIGPSNSFHINITPNSRLTSGWAGIDFYNNTTAHGSILCYNQEGSSALALYGPTNDYYAGGQIRLYSTSLTGYMTGGYNLSGGRLYSYTAYESTISTDNRVAVNSEGAIGRYKSSSRRYKEFIEDSAFDPHGLYNLKARQFKYKDGYFALDDNNPHAYDLQVGFIAEEVEQCYPAAAVYDTDTGEIESWEERKMIPPMLTLIQELNDRLTKLEQKGVF